ncbi:MAG: hypothetical protein JWO80_5064 [Bryobacterales bacterium]|nr:hypothetical protein [Bryobacterales bacterium]
MLKQAAAMLALALGSCAGAAGQCILSFNPTSNAVGTAGGNFVFAVSASTSTCPRTAVSNNADWITVSFGQTSNGTASTVGYTVKPNTVGQSRTGSISVNSQQFQIIQAPASCAFVLTPDTQSVGRTGGSYTLKVDTSCAWTTSVNATWINVTSGAAGTGPGTVSYTIAPNPATAPRTGTIQVGTQQLQITQFGSTCSYSITPATANFPALGGSGQIAINSDTSCIWTLTNSASWITTAVTTGVGATSIGYTVGANTSLTPRTAILAIAGQTATVTQAAAGIHFSAASLVNGASFRVGPVAPGEIVTIFGSGLGPVPGVTPQLTPDGNSLATSLAGTQVLFDGLAAPMIYASDTQVSAIVPYSLAGAVSTKLAIEVQGVISPAVAVNVNPSSPAIFTVPSGGTGQAAALNQDYSVNSAGNPATAGSVLQIFATGEGVTLPAGSDGRLSGSPAPVPVLQPVTAQIGGVPAQVLYAGGAPGLVAGVLQVNVLIPANAGTGSALPVVLNIGGFPTPAGVAVAIQ